MSKVNENKLLMTLMKGRTFFVLIVLIFSGICAAIVGLITTAQLTAANPSSGDGWEMNAISAVVLGGTSMSGGVGTIGGTIVGAFVIGVINDGMIMIGVSEFWQKVIKGGIIILAVIIDQYQARLHARMALMQVSESGDKSSLPEHNG